METKAWLSSICESPSSLYRFIYLVAELESMGAHKIRRSIENNGWGDDEKRHLGEESSHSALLRRFLKQDPSVSFDIGEEHFIKQMAHDYFDPLDHGTSDHVTALLGDYDPKMCYTMVSYLIECRAMEVYSEIVTLAPNPAIRDLFLTIIKDEEGHLVAMESALKGSKEGEGFWGQGDFKDLESKLYRRLQGQFLDFIGKSGALAYQASA